MLVRLVGVHKVKATLASGKRVTYCYAWRGGPRIEAEEGSAKFGAEYYRLTRHRGTGPGAGTIGALIRDYVNSEAFKGLRETTRKSYDWAFDKIEPHYSNVPLTLVERKGFRRDVIGWRDEELADTPRAADMIVSILSRVLAFGVDREDLSKNPLENIARLADSTRRDAIWSDEQIARFRAKAPARMVLAMELALWTGQRQGDLLRLTWSAYDGQYLALRQSKTGSSVRVKVAGPLRALMDGQKRTAVTILTNREGKPYGTGFRASWRKAAARAGIEGVTFHDLRGTFITLAHREGTPIKEIAEVSGHTEKDAERIIRKHYLASDSAVVALERRNEKAARL